MFIQVGREMLAIPAEPQKPRDLHIERNDGIINFRQRDKYHYPYAYPADGEQRYNERNRQGETLGEKDAGAGEKGARQRA